MVFVSLKGASARLFALVLFWSVIAADVSDAADAQCARVKIEIAQELTLERQAFDATLRIENGVTTAALESIGVEVVVTAEDGTPVVATTDPNATDAAFFLRVSTLQGISAVDGTGTVAGTVADVFKIVVARTCYAASRCLAGSASRSRFSQTLSSSVQLRVSPDHRSGWRARAAA
jgi:hypothetical protein